MRALINYFKLFFHAGKKEEKEVRAILRPDHLKNIYIEKFHQAPFSS